MLHKFRHLYPQGSLLSELVNLDQGLYVVKVTVKNQDVIFGTGLAAAETVEKAEDQARIRALLTLFTTDNPHSAYNSELFTPEALPAKAKNNLAVQNQPTNSFQKSPSPQAQPSPNDHGQAIDNRVPASFNPANITANDPSNQNWNNVNSEMINPGMVNSGKAIPINNQNLEVVNSNFGQQQNINSSNQQPPAHPTADISANPTFILENQTEAPSLETVGSSTPLAQQNGTNPEIQTPINIFDQPINSPSSSKLETPPQKGSMENTIEMDFNEVMFKIDLEMKRLGWTKEQGRNYLLSTYGKRARIHLQSEELLEFWRYLEALP